MFRTDQGLQGQPKIYNKIEDHLHQQKASRVFKQELIIKEVHNKFRAKGFSSSNSKIRHHKIKTILEEIME